MVQWLKLCLPTQEVQEKSMAREVRFHMPHGQKNKHKAEGAVLGITDTQYCNKFHKSFLNGSHQNNWKKKERENKSLVSVITSAAQYCTLASREKGSRRVTKIWKEKNKIIINHRWSIFHLKAWTSRILASSSMAVYTITWHCPSPLLILNSIHVPWGFPKWCRW